MTIKFAHYVSLICHSIHMILEDNEVFLIVLSICPDIAISTPRERRRKEIQVRFPTAE